MSLQVDPRQTGMTDDKEIRARSKRWAYAVHAGDLDVVLADHARDVLRDVRRTSSPGGGTRASMPIVPRGRHSSNGSDTRIVRDRRTGRSDPAGDDVAFADALLRCGMPQELEQEPDRRLRLTIGLRKEAGRWLVTHEHHSFTSP